MKTTLKAYWPSLRKFWYLLVMGTFLMVVNVLLNSLYPFLLRDLTTAFTAPTATMWSVETILMLIFVLFVVKNVAWWFYDYVILHFEVKVMRDLDNRSFKAIQAQSLRFFENSFAGALVKSATRFRQAFESMADAYFYQIGRSATLILLTLIVFAMQRPWMAVAFGVWTILFIVVSFYAARIRYKLSAAESEADSAIGGRLADSFTNSATVKSYGREKDEQARFGEVVEECFRRRKKSWMVGITIGRIQGFVVSGFEMLLVWWLVRGMQDGSVTVADFIFFQTYVLLLMQQLWEFGAVMHRLNQNMAEAKEMAEVYALRPEVQDAPVARPLNVEDGEIEFHAVNFSYIDRETREHHDVHDFNLHIDAGQTVAVVGHTGAGKSTLVKLLLRHFDLSSGYIRIDRQDIANVTQASLRQQIALVPQSPDLFHRSIRDNIAFARPDATDEEIIVAAKRAHAWEFIQNLPEQEGKKELDIIVGERGVKLSGGERQRIALARAFLADAPILILDEATSALDSKTEHQIQSAIADLLEGRTCIVIAHRLSTIQRADRIIVMENGSIVEEGTHDELLDSNGVYADLWSHQSGGYIK